MGFPWGGRLWSTGWLQLWGPVRVVTCLLDLTSLCEGHLGPSAAVTNTRDLAGAVSWGLDGGGGVSGLVFLLGLRSLSLEALLLWGHLLLGKGWAGREGHLPRGVK